MALFTPLHKPKSSAFIMTRLFINRSLIHVHRPVKRVLRSPVRSGCRHRATYLPLPGALLESLKPPKNLPVSYAISAVLATLYVRIAHFILDFYAHFRYHSGIVGVQQLTI
jgi:hypothetical protein